MTQSFSSSSLSSDKRDENAPSSEIRADIDQTRASVGEKIDQLQARLDPSRLKQQAQETVQEMFTDTANSMTDYVKTHKDELVSSLADAARRNPLPTALVGLGVGWLILESMSGSKRHDDDRYEYERRNFSTRDMSSRFEGSTGRSQVYQGRGQDYYNQYDQPDYRTTSYPTNAEYRSEYQGRQEYGNGHQQGSNPLAKAADAVKGAVGDVAQDIKERAEGVGNDIKERVEDMSQGIKDRASDMRQNVDERVGDMRHDMTDSG
jgi:gas vesicle protein